MQPRNLRLQLTEVLKKHHLVTVGEILARLAESGQYFNKTSVYRALDKMLEDQLICKHFFDGHEALYELRDNEEHHVHISCQKCGRVNCFEVKDLDLDSLKKAHKDDFDISHYHLTLVGTCSACR